MSVLSNVAFLFAMAIILLAGILQVIEDFWKGNPGD